MAKGQFWDDTFEKLAELGTSTAKKTVKSVGKIVNPLQALDKSSDNSQQAQQEKIAEEAKRNPNHTPLDFKQLQEKFGKSDEQKAEELRNKLFHMVKNAEKESTERGKQETQQKEQQEIREKEEKERKEKEQHQQQSGGAPHGKVHKSILGGGRKKASMEQLAEFKPSSTKN